MSRDHGSRMLALAAVLLLALPAGAQTKTVAPAPAPSPAPIKVGGLTISGSVRMRWESWDWYETSAAENRYNFGAAILRLAVSQQKERFEWMVEGAAPVLLGLPENAIAPAPQGQLGLGGSYFAANGRQDGSVFVKQAFFRIKGLGGDKASSLRFGRFEFNDGTETTPADASLATIKRDHISQRLIGTFGFTHVGRSFDGVHYVRNTSRANFTFVGARPTEGVFQLRGWRQLDVDFYYGAFTKPHKTKSAESDFRLFALHYHDGRRVLKTDNRPQAIRAADQEGIRLTTLGGHYIAAHKAGAGKADVLLWAAGQFGDWGPLRHRAGAIAVEGGYQFGGSPAAERLKPWIRGGYFHSTGDNNPNDNRHGTFFQVLPTPRIYARFPFYDLVNNEDVFAQLRLKPHARIGLRTDAHHLRLASDRDQWYLGGGAFQQRTFGYIGRPSNGRRSLGWLFDISADLALAPRTAVTVYFAGNRGGAVQQAIHPQGGANPTARFFYLELAQRF